MEAYYRRKLSMVQELEIKSHIGGYRDWDILTLEKRNFENGREMEGNGSSLSELKYWNNAEWKDFVAPTRTMGGELQGDH